MEILPLLVCLEPFVSQTSRNQLAIICEAVFSMTGRITMLGISRFTKQGGSYRSVQRFFSSTLCWSQIFLLFFLQHLFNSDELYILAGDETVVTKAGTDTHGIDRFFSSLYGKPVSGIAFFALSLVSVKEGRSYPISVEQVVRTEEEKEAAKERTKERKEKKKKKDKDKSSGPKGRPKGSRNKEKTQFTPTAELTRINKQITALMTLIRAFLPLTYLALDGHFGHNQALLMAREHNLQIISKLKQNSALYQPFEGRYSGRGPRPRYGKRIDYKNLPEKYLKQRKQERGFLTSYYQATLLHKEFCQALNVVIIVKRNLKTEKESHVLLFSSDCKLDYNTLVAYYSLRFQIEFNFRDAKQHWGLEDFMNQTEESVTNAAKLSFFMVNLSQVLLKDFRRTFPQAGVLDLKSYFRGLKYADLTLKLLLQKPDPIFIEQIKQQVSSLGRIHG